MRGLAKRSLGVDKRRVSFHISGTEVLYETCYNQLEYIFYCVGKELATGIPEEAKLSVLLYTESFYLQKISH
ncbi:hypothetical protein chiPu_0016533 [Chiloscyllium punctatum]|uniref:Uncharacterized protein n=1 Tax=Chiloscyllium punctatum TaxID=137246 RepID=A0A401T5W9_CHIPU|nr:hypothetical protein [Chiloscyllium punctatum]